jgi:hypothetical protein
VKFRMSNQGTMFGWHVARLHGYGYEKNNIDLNMAMQTGLTCSMAEGDFREAGFYGGEVIRKGWYIDRKTGLKIETNF